MHRLLTAASALALMAVSTAAHSSGFQLNERSTKALGASLSGSVSAASDVSFMAYNPAALSTVEHIEIGGNTAFVSPISETEFAGEDVDADQAALVPGFAAGYRINDEFTVGVTSYSPFGLVTDYDDTPLTAVADVSRLTTVVVAPTVTWQPMDSVALGASLNLIYADARLTQDAVQLEGDTFDVSFSVGAMFKPAERTQIGVAYHHGYDLSLEGSNTLNAAPFATGTFDTTADAELPAWIGVGVTQGVTDDLRVMAEARWLGWSSFDRIEISTPGAPDLSPLGPDFSDLEEVQNYEDAWFFAVGAEYDASDKLTVRGGVAWDGTPTTDEDRTLRVPDSDRLWLSAGASYAVSESMTLDASYSYLHGLDDPEVSGDFGTVEFDGGAHILSVGGSIKF